MIIGIPKESLKGEARVAATPETVKKFIAKGAQVLVEKGAGKGAHFTDAQFREAGAKMGSADEALGADVVLKINKPTAAEAKKLKKGAVLAALLDPCHADSIIKALAKGGVSAFSMEKIPRISRAQSMDVLSSQANIAGYRAVLEATAHYKRFFPMMMTSAGSAKPAKLIVLGVGVAGLQAIATARRLGAQVEAFDVRPETREQVLSLGAKFIDLDLGESGSGEGGYARELSDEAKQKQQELLTERYGQADVIVTTALIPCRPAPILVTAKAVSLMKPGSVVIDMAAANGGNCELTRADKVVVKGGVSIVGHTNYPSMMATDASAFFARNHFNFLALLMESGDDGVRLKDFSEDEITKAALITHDGKLLLED